MYLCAPLVVCRLSTTHRATLGYARYAALGALRFLVGAEASWSPPSILPRASSLLARGTHPSANLWCLAGHRGRGVHLGLSRVADGPAAPRLCRRRG